MGLVYWFACPKAKAGSPLEDFCGVADRYGYQVAIGLAMLYVYIRVLNMAGLKVNRRRAPAASS